MNYEYGTKLDAKTHQRLLNNIEQKFFKKKSKKGSLLWSFLKVTPRMKNFSEIKSLGINVDLDVFIYFEREEEIHSTKYNDIIKFVEYLEPWDEFDAYVFNFSFEWLIVLTHEDVMLTVGL